MLARIRHLVRSEQLHQRTDCEPATPYTTDQAVTADLTGTLTGETTYYYRFAAKNADGAGYGAVKSFTPHNVNFLKTDPASNITRTEARLNGSYEGTNEETEYWFEWRLGTSGSFTKTPVETEGMTTGPTSLHYDLGGLTAGKTYSYRVAAKNSKGESIGQTVEFQTSPAVKNVVTKPATGISNTEATLNGSLDPDGYATTYYFELGKDTTYGQTVPLPPGIALGDISPGDQDVSVPLTDLEPARPITTAWPRPTASKRPSATTSRSPTPQPPSITSFNAINLAADSADLVATINPNGYATEYWFEYGMTTGYGTTVPVPNGELPPETTVQKVDVPITGLEERTYHFRLTAKSERGTVGDGRPELQLQPAGELPEQNPAPADRLGIRSRLPGLRARLGQERQWNRAVPRRPDLADRGSASSRTPASSIRSRIQANRRRPPSASNRTWRPARRPAG